MEIILTYYTDPCLNPQGTEGAINLIVLSLSSNSLPSGCYTMGSERDLFPSARPSGSSFYKKKGCRCEYI